MTGFGKASGELNGVVVSVEVSSVNHRFLDVSVRMPSEWSAVEPVLRELLSKRVSRGKVSVNVNRRRGGEAAQTLRFDADIARRYVEASRELAHLAGNEQGRLTVDALAQLEGVFYFAEEQADLDATKTLLAALLENAAAGLNDMRRTEGAALKTELVARLGTIRAALERVAGRLPEINRFYEERLRERLRALALEAGIREERLALEAALMSEKGDVTEEAVRIKAHLEHALEIMDSAEPSGRQLNFLTQELQREINTLGSKVRDTAVVRETLDMKAELEKFREQIQNIE